MYLQWLQSLYLSWELKKILSIKTWNPSTPFCVLGLFFQEMATEHHKYQITICKSFAPWGLPSSGLWPVWITIQGLSRVWAISLQYLISMSYVKRGQKYFQLRCSLLFPHLLIFRVCVFEWRKQIGWPPVERCWVLLALLWVGLLNLEWLLL